MTKIDWNRIRRTYTPWYERPYAFDDPPPKEARSPKPKRKKRRKSKKREPAKSLINWVHNPSSDAQEWMKLKQPKRPKHLPPSDDPPPSTPFQ